MRLFPNNPTLKPLWFNIVQPQLIRKKKKKKNRYKNDYYASGDAPQTSHMEKILTISILCCKKRKEVKIEYESNKKKALNVNRKVRRT